MANSSPSPGTAPNAEQWNVDKVFAALGDPTRRRLLLSLARGGPQTGIQLTGNSERRLDATLKHLAAMRSAGLVVTQENPGDGRRLIYTLAPAVPLMNTPTGQVIDFGFCLLRLSGA